MRVEGTGSSGVFIVGPPDDYGHTSSFNNTSRAGAVLHRAITRIGARPEMFWIWEATPGEIRSELGQLIAHLKPRVIVALGSAFDEVALQVSTGLSGPKLGTGHLCGYLLPPAVEGWPPVIPAFHPSWLRVTKGAMSLFGVLMRTLKLSLQVAKEQLQPVLPAVDNPPAGYLLHPTEAVALEFEREAASTQEGYLAYDIETYYSADEEAAEENVGHQANEIRSIQFSTRCDSGIFMPWREPFLPIAKRILANDRRKINWNGWRFDDPLLRANAAPPLGQVIDLMWAWHHSQPDLKRGLQFAAAMQGPNIYNPTARWPWPWKHYSTASPQFYGIVDVAVLQWMVNYA